MALNRQETFWIRAAAGKVDGWERLTIFGDNTDIDTTSDPETVWSGGGLYPWLDTAADTLDIVSTDANDTSAGTGARTVLVQGLLAGEEVSEVFTLNGTSAVNGSQTFNKVNNVVVTSAGSGNTNAGEINLTTNGGSNNLLGHIQAGFSKSDQAVYTVPNNKTLFIVGVVIAAGKSGTSHVEVDLHVRGASGVWLNTNRADLDSDVNASPINLSTYPISLVAGTDIEMIATEVTANNTECIAVLHCWLVENRVL
jgi:hypothetical protein